MVNPVTQNKSGRPTGARSPDASTIRTGGRSNGWADEAAALQLFAHLEGGGGLNVARRTGVDPATFTTELEILAVRGFGDMGTCARNRMVQDRFIADQRSCGLRLHLDSVPPDTPIREIVDRCWVWESHLEQKSGSSPGTDLDRGHSGVSVDSRELFRENSLRTVGCPEVESRIPVPFSCGRPGHGVNRCSRMDTSFPFLLRGWSVDIWDGQYRAVWPGGSMARSPPGNEGWSGRSASRIICDQGTIDPGGGERASPVTRSQLIWGSLVGHVHGSGWSSSTHAFPPLGSHPPVFPSGIHKRDNRSMLVLVYSVLGQRDRVVPDTPIGMGGSSPSFVLPVSGARRPRMGMRPAGWNSRSPKKVSGDYVATDNGVVPDGKTSEVGKMDSFPDGLAVKRNASVVPIR